MLKNKNVNLNTLIIFSNTLIVTIYYKNNLISAVCKLSVYFTTDKTYKQICF